MIRGILPPLKPLSSRSSEAVIEGLLNAINMASRMGITITKLAIDHDSFVVFMKDKTDNILMAPFGPVTIQGEENV